MQLPVKRLGRIDTFLPPLNMIDYIYSYIHRRSMGAIECQLQIERGLHVYSRPAW